MSDDKEVDRVADQYLASLDEPIRMIEPANWVYKAVIKRLLKNWQPNYFMGDMKHEWWHKPTGEIEEMTDEEFSIVSEVEETIREQIRLEMDIE